MTEATDITELTKKETNNRSLEISVVIPVRNEANSINELMEALLDQSLKPNEIVIADGGSTDDTATILDGYSTRGISLKLLRIGPALPGRGRNQAAAAARYEWLAFIDAGVKPERIWLQRLKEKANDGSVDVVYGSYEPVIDNLFTECAALAYLTPAQKQESGYLRPRSIASALMRRSVWQEVGGFREDLRSAEDLLFMNKIEAAGYAVGFAPKALVHWRLQPTLWATFRRFVNYARNNMRAGLWRQWQAPIFRRYLLLLLVAVPAVLLGFVWITVPLLLWLIMMSARASVAIYRNRESYPASVTRNLARFMVLIPLLAVLDTALFLGTAQWVLFDKFHRGGETIEVGNAT